MTLLIDGYNLIFAAGLIPRGIGPGTLQRARTALLNYLLAHLPADQVQQTVVVFDAKRSPINAEAETDHHGLRVLFARDYEEADDLIEQLIRHESAPRKLVVVTSDLRLRVAANRRRATAVKSEDWLDQIEQAPASDLASSKLGSYTKPPNPTEQDVAAWLEEFGLDSERTGEAGTNRAINNDAQQHKPTRRKPSRKTGLNGRTNDPSESTETGDWGPFPPGYGEDLIDDDKET